MSGVLPLFFLAVIFRYANRPDGTSMTCEFVHLSGGEDS
jgi:hypothetical protein